MKKKIIPDKIANEHLALDYLAQILVDAFFDKMVDEDPNYKDPRINQPIYDLVNESKRRNKIIKFKNF